MPLEPKLMRQRGVYLYILSFFGRYAEPVGPIKIGITSNVASRLASIQTGQHRPVFVLAAFDTPDREIAREREGAFHAQFASKRLEGEWFDVDPIDALEASCAIWRYYFQQIPGGAESIGVPFYERETKVYRAWREHYAETTNVKRLGAR